MKKLDFEPVPPQELENDMIEIPDGEGGSYKVERYKAIRSYGQSVMWRNRKTGHYEDVLLCRRTEEYRAMNRAEGYHCCVLQFGEGNFLRAFVGPLMKAVAEYGISRIPDIYIIKPRPGVLKRMHKVQRQEYARGNWTRLGWPTRLRYHVVERGMENGVPVERVEEINNVHYVMDSSRSLDRLRKCFMRYDNMIVVSNTTEAGIFFRETDKFDDWDSMTFPGKLTWCLYQRFEYELDTTWILPMELIPDNGQILKACVLRYADHWKLGNDFKWVVENWICFADTLVDRIVSGPPRTKADKEHIRELIGEDDPLAVICEPFGQLVIKTPSQMLPVQLPPGHLDVEVIYADHIDLFRLRKVWILNGSHTNLVALGLLMGKQTVFDCMEDPTVYRYIRDTIYEEILPFLPGQEDYAEQVLERFRNPYLNHQLTSILLNTLAKWPQRVKPSFNNYYQRFGVIPKHLTLGLACLIHLYQRAEELPDGRFRAKIGRRSILLKDNPEQIRALRDLPLEQSLALWQIWDTDLTTRTGLVDALKEILERLEKGEKPL